MLPWTFLELPGFAPFTTQFVGQKLELPLLIEFLESLHEVLKLPLPVEFLESPQEFPYRVPRVYRVPRRKVPRREPWWRQRGMPTTSTASSRATW